MAVSPILTGLLSLHLSAQGGQKPRSDDQTIRLKVEMVSLPVVVTDRQGGRVPDLHKDDFQVYEDGIIQEIAGFGVTDEPVSVALAIDTSGSVEDQLARMQNEAIHFVNLLHPDDSVAVMSFAQDVQLLEDWSIDRERNARGIKETRHGTCTKVYEARREIPPGRDQSEESRLVGAHEKRGLRLEGQPPKSGACLLVALISSANRESDLIEFCEPFGSVRTA